MNISILSVLDWSHLSIGAARREGGSTHLANSLLIDYLTDVRYDYSKCGGRASMPDTTVDGRITQLLKM